MEVLYISLKPIDSDWVDLIYRLPSKPAKTQRLKLSDIQTLVDQGERLYYVRYPILNVSHSRLKAIGQQLFFWLDGAGRWLTQAIHAGSRGLILAVAAEERLAHLAHLPWEVLHDGEGFLVERTTRPIVPVRWINESRTADYPALVPPLQLFFMATSPEGEAELDFEKEEAEIVKIAKELPLDLRVEESGSVEVFSKIWQRFPEDTFHVFHLTGHASIEENKPHDPYFITEDLCGKRKEVKSEELIQSFGCRFPRLIFLSGCHTGQGGNAGAVSSMAEALVKQGIPAVLSWGNKIREETATDAAAHFYERLAYGDSIAQAVGSTYRELRKRKRPDWHLLRVYACNKAWGQLVSEPGDYVPDYEPVQMSFLDARNKIEVATPEDFVGRRRLLQECLRELRSSGCLGVLLHGPKGVGKSSVAARLVGRMTKYTPLRINGLLNIEEVKILLAEMCESARGHEILNDDRLPDVNRLTKFLKLGLNNSEQSEQKLCFILDNFEANLEPRPHGTQVLKYTAVHPLETLLRAVVGSRKGHRVIITSLHDVPVPFPVLDNRLYRKQVDALSDADLEKIKSRKKIRTSKNLRFKGERCR